MCMKFACYWLKNKIPFNFYEYSLFRSFAGSALSCLDVDGGGDGGAMAVVVVYFSCLLLQA